MIAPRIHLNGDRQQTLIDDLAPAHRAISAAIIALRDVAPHHRNYYVISDAAWSQARAEHESRVLRLRDVNTELEALALAISEGKIEFTV